MCIIVPTVGRRTSFWQTRSENKGSTLRADIGWVFLAFVVTTLGQLAQELLHYLLLCAGQTAQLASVTAGDVSTPVDEDGEEPAEAHNPTFFQLLVLILQQLKNTILVEVLEAVAGRVLGKYMGFRSDQLLQRMNSSMVLLS